MPRKTAANDSATTPVRAAKPKTPKTAPVVGFAPKAVSTPRVKSAKHKTDAPVAVIEIAETTQTAVTVNAQEQIAKIAYGYWEARGFQPGSPEEDWVRAEQEFLLNA
jgi:hypothetical protein